MSTDFSIKPVRVPAATPVIQPSSEGTANAASPELPAGQSVPAAGASVRNDPQTASDFVSHQVVIDRAAASIVYQVVDNRTNLAVQQLPDEAALRRRAYLRALDPNRGPPTPHIVTDRKA